MRGLEVTPKWLEDSIRYFRSNGVDIIDLDEVCLILSGNAPARPFVVYTFDDGYEDNFTFAYPVFKKHNAAFTVYLITNFPEREYIPWWHLLEDLILRGETLRVKHTGGTLVLDCSTGPGRENALYELRSIILDSFRGDYFSTLCQILQSRGIELTKYSDIGMSWDQVRQLSSDPLVTIGAHGVRHVPMSRVSNADMERELTESRSIIECKIQKAVRHFAFPYGSVLEAGIREFQAASACGYRTAVTTRPANVFPEHANSLSSLPRALISGEREGRNPELLSLWLSGTIPALENRFRRVVTD